MVKILFSSSALRQAGCRDYRTSCPSMSTLGSTPWSSTLERPWRPRRRNKSLSSASLILCGRTRRAAINLALPSNHELVFDLVAKRRIHGFRSAQRGFFRNVVQPHHFLDERILPRQIMRHPARLHPFISHDARGPTRQPEPVSTYRTASGYKARLSRRGPPSP